MMIRISVILFYMLFLPFTSGNLYAQAQTEKPWTYWWWMGSAVTEEGVKYQLENLANAGIGGVHVIPIYGVKGYEDHFIPYLSKKWMKMLHYTVEEAGQLGMGVDMTTGTGWPFGGPWVTPAMAGKQYKIENGKFIVEPAGMKVKRAAPGDEGWVVDFFDKKAVLHYLERFDRALDTSGIKLRAMYCDSYEAHRADWTGYFLEEFKKRRGYDLGKYVALFRDTTGDPDAVLIKMDYQKILSELLYEYFASEWTGWSKDHGYITRYQAHGSPGNLLDLYALSDIPETESFGSSRFPIPGLRVEKIDTKPDPLFMKFASSAAHVAGRKLVSSETATWLDEHFKVSLSQVKPQVDELFAAGINHIFFHGIAYSPPEEPYPGWLFYASTNFGLQSAFWKQLPLLNEYIRRCQHILQNSETDNDILLYFPMEDVWGTTVSSYTIQQLTAHNLDQWLFPTSFGRIAGFLQDNGFTFDYVSDRQLKQLEVNKAGLLTPGHSVYYETLVVPAVTYMSENTLERLLTLAKQGATIIFTDHLPLQVSGYYKHKEFNMTFRKKIDEMKRFPEHVMVTGNLQKALNGIGIFQENFAKNGLRFIRMIYKGNTAYFVTNPDNRFRKGWIELAASPNNVRQYNALTDSVFYLPVRYDNNNGRAKIYLDLLPGQSCFLFCDNNKKNPVDINTGTYKNFVLKGEWRIDFVEGKPKLPASAVMNDLVSWTALPDSAEYFSGTAKYTLKFDLPDSMLDGREYILDLGDVRESAAVKLNGRYIGTAWCIPFRLAIDGRLLKRKDNVLEAEVTNLAANYMRIRDTRPPEWKKFYDINFVDIHYKPFSTRNWSPMHSGLVTNVKILYKQRAGVSLFFERYK